MTKAVIKFYTMQVARLVIPQQVKIYKVRTFENYTDLHLKPQVNLYGPAP